MRTLKIQSLPSVQEAWVDRDQIMLHACFQILKDCVDREQVDTHANYETHKETVDEVRFLYKWWEERLSNKEWDSYEEDNVMLLRLIKIRGFLWT